MFLIVITQRRIARRAPTKHYGFDGSPPLEVMNDLDSDVNFEEAAGNVLLCLIQDFVVPYSASIPPSDQRCDKYQSF